MSILLVVCTQVCGCDTVPTASQRRETQFGASEQKAVSASRPSGPARPGHGACPEPRVAAALPPSGTRWAFPGLAQHCRPLGCFLSCLHQAATQAGTAAAGAWAPQGGRGQREQHSRRDNGLRPCPSPGPRGSPLAVSSAQLIFPLFMFCMGSLWGCAGHEAQLGGVSRASALPTEWKCPWTVSLAFYYSRDKWWYLCPSLEKYGPYVTFPSFLLIAS